MQVLVSVYNFGNRTTPLTSEHRADFSEFAASLARSLPRVRHFIVGNEPNLNRYWLPQFNDDGTNAAAPAYTALLAQTYDALKAVRRDIVVLGGALAPRGGDQPNPVRPTHSPTKFIRDMGAAYRSSERTRPLMDGLAHHPYVDNSSVKPSENAHPRSTTI